MLSLREKELRIALVCFGGVSLAIYMHGISKEILKLVRASSALHAIADRARRAKASFFDFADRDDPEYDTEDVYFELLREIGRSVELRVIVDIIAGASAGGINGTMLARALSHDLPMDALRDLWLDERRRHGAAVARCARRRLEQVVPQARSSGPPPSPGCLRAITDMEVRQKLSLFVRSRWFKPPLDGRIMAGLMYDAVVVDGRGRQQPKASLLPSGQSLDLFVTLTDYHGYQQLVQIHDPPLIHERDHHHVLQFTYRRHATGAVESDFDLDNAPALAFAARATSSFPGAFPPARIVEMDEVVAQRHGGWPRRAEFIAKSFPQPSARRCRSRPWRRFIDGSVLNNRPFQEAISAIHGRPAYRAGRPAAGLYRAASGAAGDRRRQRAHAGLLRDVARRAVGHSELAAGDRRAQLGGRVQRPGAAPARDHRQRAPAGQPAGGKRASPRRSIGRSPRRSCAAGASR